MRILIAVLILAAAPAVSEAGLFGLLRCLCDPPSPPQPSPPPIVQVIPHLIGQLPVQPQLPIQPQLPVQPPGNGLPIQPPIQGGVSWQPVLTYQADQYGRLIPTYYYVPVRR